MQLIQFYVDGRWRSLLAVMVCSLALQACSGGGDTDVATVNDNSNETGELALALTDAEGDFLSYLVDVTAITLTRSDGSSVETLPLSTSVDFAQYVDVSELLTLATVPAGVYTDIQLLIDYSNAEVVVQAENGDAIEAELVDSAGDPLTEFSVSIELHSGSDFRIAPGIPAQVTLDFDLDASNEITINGDTATVVVDPVLLADTDFENPKALRLRGLLNEVAVDEAIFSLDLRPFLHRSGRFGAVRVQVNDDTSYEINGEVYSAEQGLQQLETLAEDTPVVTMGEWDRSERRYSADTVYAGSSVSWSDADILRGVVVAREDNSLTIRGAVLSLQAGERRFAREITVSVSEDTTVTLHKNGLDEGSIADLSVGSKIVAMGEISEQNGFDASEGQVRVLRSNLTGRVVTVSPLSVDLQRLSGINQSRFDFSGTGTDASSDADPDNYEIDIASLPLAGLQSGDPVKLRGTVKAFGTAPDDYSAQTLWDVSAIDAQLIIHYDAEGGSNALTALSDSSITLDISASPYRHHIIQAGVLTDLSEQTATLQINAAAGRGLFALVQRGEVQMFREFADFSAALDQAVTAGQAIIKVTAHGSYNNQAMSLDTSRLQIRLSSE